MKWKIRILYVVLCLVIDRNKESVNELNKVSIGVWVRRVWEKIMELGYEE